MEILKYHRTSLISYERGWPLACQDGLIKPNQASHQGARWTSSVSMLKVPVLALIIETSAVWPWKSGIWLCHKWNLDISLLNGLISGTGCRINCIIIFNLVQKSRVLGLYEPQSQKGQRSGRTCDLWNEPLSSRLANPIWTSRHLPHQKTTIIRQPLMSILIW
jgi:hypothetical protein